MNFPRLLFFFKDSSSRGCRPRVNQTVRQGLGFERGIRVNIGDSPIRHKSNIPPQSVNNRKTMRLFLEPVFIQNRHANPTMASRRENCSSTAIRSVSPISNVNQHSKKQSKHWERAMSMVFWDRARNLPRMFIPTLILNLYLIWDLLKNRHNDQDIHVIIRYLVNDLIIDGKV